MFLFILAILCGIVGLILAVAGKVETDYSKVNLRPWGIAVLLIGIIPFLFSILTFVPTGHVGVVTIFGKVQPEVLHEGMHAILPWANAHKLSIQQQVYTKTMNASTQGGVTIDIVVNIVYRLDPEHAADIYQNMGKDYFVVLVEPFINDISKNLFVDYEAEAMYTSERPMVKQRIEAAFVEFLEPQGVTVIGTPIENMDLPNRLLTAIIERDEAEQEALRLEFVKEQTQREAEIRVIEAEGLAQAQSIINSTLTPEYLQYLSLEKIGMLADSPNCTYVLAVGENGMPMILNPDTQQ